MAANTIKGSIAGGAPADLTQAEVLTMLQNPLLIVQVNVDFNAVADYTLTIPSWVTRYGIQFFRIINTGTTASLTTAQYGVFTATGGGGTAIIASGSSLAAITSNAANTAANFLQPGLTVSAYWTTNPLYFRVTTAQGAAASGTVYLCIIPFPS